jgi:hypothetical protein
MAWTAFKSGPLANGRRPEIARELTPTSYPYWAQGGLGGMAIHDRAETVDAMGNQVPSPRETLVREESRAAAGRFTGGQDALPARKTRSRPYGSIQRHGRSTIFGPP